MQVTANQVRRSVNAKYTLWDGEMTVRVMQHTGAHGYHSAVIVVERVDSPLEVQQWDGYDQFATTLDREQGAQRMLEWIANQLTRLSQGTALAVGTECQVVGLLQE